MTENPEITIASNSEPPKEPETLDLQPPDLAPISEEEKNLTSLMATGKEVFDNLPPTPLDNAKLRGLLGKLNFFDFYPEETPISLATMESYLHLALGVATTLSYDDMGLLQEYFFTEKSYRTLAEEKLGSRHQKDIIRGSITTLLRRVRFALLQKQGISSELILPENWVNREEFLPQGQATEYETPRGEISLRTILEVSYHYEASFAIEAQDGENQIKLDFPSPKPSIPIEQRG